MVSPLRIAFAGTPDFAVPALNALLDAGHEVAAVYTQPDRPAGRGRRLRPSPVKAAAERAGLPVRQPPSLRNASEREALAALAPEVLVVVAYGVILPASVLGIPRHGCVNIHASLLPRWRGAAPIQRALLAGDERTGVCIMRMSTGLDTGPVIACEDTPIRDDDTGGSLHDRLAAMGAELIAPTLEGWVRGELAERPQPEQGVTYADKLTIDETRVDWNETATAIERRIRAFDPWPVARTRYRDTELRLWRARVLPGPAQGTAGQVVSAGGEGIDVATGDGVLRLEELQLAGRRRQDVASFLNGFRLVAGEHLG
ncbi:MAG: methionyl-tRNA formyltransferase [Arhodomonas sp.]|nr:methionyl-tRNA formyltransferase [Arhodomonas sp.]